MSDIFGFDFGTTNSLISFVSGNEAKCLLDDGYPHPSVVCYQGDKKIIGRKAKERLSEAKLGVIGNIVRSPKTLLGENRIFVDGVVRNPKDVVKDIVEHIRAAALDSKQGRDYGSRFDKAVVTIPIDMNGERRKQLREAFRMAGIAISQFVHEPLAALYGHLRSKKNFSQALQELEREVVLVYDWGGGTLDITLCQIKDGMLVQLKNTGCNTVGGDVIDEMIRNEVIKRVLKNRGIEESLPVQPLGMEKLLNIAERAKIELSIHETSQIYVSNFFQTQKYDPDLDYELSRKELNEICNEKISEGIGRIHELLESARFSSSSVALCLATGGMVNMPAIKSNLREIFGSQRLEVSNHGGTIIAEGAAWIAHDDKRLSLAKNIEVYVAVDSHFPIVKAGTLMPREGTVQKQSFSLYCTDPRDGVAKFQIKSPKKCGKEILATEQRNILKNLSINVDAKARAFFERLQLDAAIDDNLILNISALSSIANDRDEIEIHDIEFGLELPELIGGKTVPTNHKSAVITKLQLVKAAGLVSVRSNVSDKDDKSLVPGELMAELEPTYMYHGNNPPKRQLDECTYYLPCSVCGRAWNDIECVCSECR